MFLKFPTYKLHFITILLYQVSMPGSKLSRCMAVFQHWFKIPSWFLHWTWANWLKILSAFDDSHESSVGFPKRLVRTGWVFNRKLNSKKTHTKNTLSLNSTCWIVKASWGWKLDRSSEGVLLLLLSISNRNNCSRIQRFGLCSVVDTLWWIRKCRLRWVCCSPLQLDEDLLPTLVKF